jgi:hypothetical protein
MKHITLERVFWLLAIIALLILLKKCGTERDEYKAERDKTHTLRRELQDDTASMRRQIVKYRQDSAQASLQTKQHAKRADSIDKTRRLLEREIKQLYAELGKPWPRDTLTDSSCCVAAYALVQANEAHRSDDSAKDAAMLMQIDLAAERIDTLGAQLIRANSRFIQLDSIPIDKPSGAVWIGVEANVGPVSSGGLYLRYATTGGKEYGVVAGFQPMGWYLGAKVGTKISLRKKRR